MFVTQQTSLAGYRSLPVRESGRDIIDQAFAGFRGQVVLSAGSSGPAEKDICFPRAREIENRPSAAKDEMDGIETRGISL